MASHFYWATQTFYHFRWQFHWILLKGFPEAQELVLLYKPQKPGATQCISFLPLQTGSSAGLLSRDTTPPSPQSSSKNTVLPLAALHNIYCTNRLAAIKYKLRQFYNLLDTNKPFGAAFTRHVSVLLLISFFQVSPAFVLIQWKVQNFVFCLLMQRKIPGERIQSLLRHKRFWRTLLIFCLFFLKPELSSRCKTEADPKHRQAFCNILEILQKLLVSQRSAWESPAYCFLWHFLPTNRSASMLWNVFCFRTKAGNVLRGQLHCLSLAL